MVDPSAPGVPVSWAELVPAEREHLEEHSLLFLGRLAERPAETDPQWSAARLLIPAETLSAAAAVLPAHGYGGLFERLQPRAAAALPVFESAPDSSSSELWLHALSYFSVARCCGGPVPPQAVEDEIGWIRELGTAAAVAEDYRQRLLFAVVAVGLTPLVPRLSDDPMPDRAEPGRVFEFDAPGFIRYLARAFEERRPAADVEPAWVNFAARFPYKLAAKTLDWVDLLWAARAYYTLFEGRPVESVGAGLHELVMELAQ